MDIQEHSNPLELMQTHPIEDKAFWDHHISNYTDSGLSKSSYAKRHSLNYARFLYWYRKRSESAKTANLIPISIKQLCPDNVLCSIAIGNHDLKIYNLSVLDHLLVSLN